MRGPSFILVAALALSIAVSSLARADELKPSQGQRVRPAEPSSTDGIEFFEKHIRPVLVKHCYKCHSAEAKTLEAGLRLDSREGMLKGGDSGPAVVPGAPEKSQLVKAIRHVDEDLRMPPEDRLSDDVVKRFAEWIKIGAPHPRVETTLTQWAGIGNLNKVREFWSLRPVAGGVSANGENTSRPSNVIDRYLHEAMQSRGITPVGAADKRTLIRRATYDLTGLPPTPDEIDAFLADESPDAFARVVDRLLQSPHYGEQWGRHWLDLVRYADTSGCNSDFPVPSAYRYRNYVIQSFNDDKPYDQFVREQLAGDLLPADTVERRNEQVIATGYLAISRRLGSRNNEFHLTIEDTIDNLGKVFLGLTVSCARCHDHKFDPVSKEDYYALYGIFASTKYAFPGTEIYRHAKDFAALGGPEQAEKLREWETELADADDKIELLVRELARLKVREANGETFAPGERTPLHAKADMQELKTKLERLEDRPPPVDKAFAVSDGSPKNATLHRKGDPKDLGDEIPRGFLEVLGGQRLPPDAKGSGRLELASWIVDSDNPLTARVMVNRIWQFHFGKGIVQTPNDFGTRGKPPAHPELLDYLARRFVESGWSIKAIHRMIMLSDAYRRTARTEAGSAGASPSQAGASPSQGNSDPNNDYLWRFDRRRLSAEEVRDSLMAVAGTLDHSVGGEHPLAPEGEWRYTQHKPFIAVYPSNKRTVYVMQQRIKRHPLLETFDGPDPNASTAARSLSTTAIQALYFMNDPFVHEQADQLAVRVGLAHNETPARLDYAYELALGRHATADELREGEEYVSRCREELAATGLPRDQLNRAALASYARVLLSSNEFLFVE
jgi:hypothetical protein